VEISTIISKSFKELQGLFYSDSGKRPDQHSRPGGPDPQDSQQIPQKCFREQNSIIWGILFSEYETENRKYSWTVQNL